MIRDDLISFLQDKVPLYLPAENPGIKSYTFFEKTTDYPNLVVPYPAVAYQDMGATNFYRTVYTFRCTLESPINIDPDKTMNILYEIHRAIFDAVSHYPTMDGQSEGIELSNAAEPGFVGTEDNAQFWALNFTITIYKEEAVVL